MVRTGFSAGTTGPTNTSYIAPVEDSSHPCGGFQKPRKNLRFAHASAKADAYNLLTGVGASFSWRGREAAFASFETAFCGVRMLVLFFPGVRKKRVALAKFLSPLRDAI